MAYLLDIDPAAGAQIRELPPTGTAALADAFEVLSLNHEYVPGSARETAEQLALLMGQANT